MPKSLLLTNLAIILIAIPAMVFQNCSGRQENPVWSVNTARSFIKRIPDPDSIHWLDQANHFSWQAGYIMFAMEKMWRSSGDSLYFHYIRRYVDQQVDEQVDQQVDIPDFEPTALDNFLPGYAIIFIYEQTRQEKYKTAAKIIRAGLNNYPRTSDGLFWHADWASHQAWVDGVFMGQMFLARYGSVIGDSANAFDEVVRQMTLIADHCQKENGLLLHGWDESRQAGWADKATGLAPEVWSEGLGWYAVLIADVFDYLPKTHPGYEKIINIHKKLCAGLRQTQDPNTGLWCQVVDKYSEPDNWNETSGTGMFLYLIKKSIDRGYINTEEYTPVVEKAYAGLIKKAKINRQGFVDLFDCSSIGIQNNYKDYISQPKEINTFAAFGSFMLGTWIMEKHR